LPVKAHPYLPNATDEIRARMLSEIGVDSVDSLYSDIPNEIRVAKPLAIEGFSSEQEVRAHIEALLRKNRSANDDLVFLGAGIYNHYIPAVVKAITSRTEFQTSYTPYQAEVSQGLLQGLFEFQSLMADLAAVDVVNSSLYDAPTGIGEAARMAARANGRKKLLVPSCLHPDKLSVIRNYAEPAGQRVEQYAYDLETGGVDLEDIQCRLDSDTSAVYMEVPSFFGVLDSGVTEIPSMCHARGALAIVGFDIISLGGIKPPGEYGADIVVAEGQSISTEMNYGGPSLGIIGCRGEGLTRQMPGRLIGMTTTVNGKDRAFSMVLQTREQHIRRERATSNICTNEALLALGAATYLSLLGPSGLNQLFRTILTKTQYAIETLGANPELIVPRFKSPHYQDFVVTLKGKDQPSRRVQEKMLESGIQCGKNLTSDFPEIGESILLSVSELNTQESIDRLGSVFGQTLKGNVVEAV
jgi:glycine cleavage system P protein (glycine dehydrogenase) subunit 1